MGAPGDTDEIGRRSLDHPFLDQGGIPTFVECKRASDARVRREVVAQILDHAAKGEEHWDIDRIRQSAAETAQSEGKSLDHQTEPLLSDETDPSQIDAYWD